MTIYDRALLDAIEALPTTQWRGRVWRHMFNDYAPERVNTGGARWNPRGVGAIYAALESETAIAEGDHMIAMQPRRIFRRRVLYELDVEIDSTVDLTAPGSLQSVGLTGADVADPNFEPCQRVGGAIAWLGQSGILVPSARHSGDNLVILIGSGGDVDIRRVSQRILFDDASS